MSKAIRQVGVKIMIEVIPIQLVFGL